MLAPAIPAPPHQVVGDLLLACPRRVAAGVLASDSEGTVCLALAPGELVLARAMGLRVCEAPRAAHDALVHLGLALVAAPDPARTAPSDALAHHPAAPLRAVVEAAAGTARTVARALVALDLDAALVVDGRLGPGAAAYLVKAGAARTVRLPDVDDGQPEVAGSPERVLAVDADACLAALRGARTPLGEQLAWDAASLLWVGGWMPRFGDVLGWTRARQRRGVELSRYA